MDQQTPYDLIVFVSKSFDIYTNEVTKYATTRRAKFVKADRASPLVDAINARYTEINKGVANSRKISVLIACHGDETDGAFIGGSGDLGDYTTENILDDRPMEWLYKC